MTLAKASQSLVMSLNKTSSSNLWKYTLLSDSASKVDIATVQEAEPATDSSPATDSPPSATDFQKSIDRVEELTKQLTKQLNDKYDRDFRNTCIQYSLFITVILLEICCYIFFPLGLFVIMIFCFVFAWTFPSLHVPLWGAIILLVVFGYHFVTGSFTWTWLPQH